MAARGAIRVKLAAVGAAAVLMAMGLSQAFAQPFAHRGGFPSKPSGRPGFPARSFDRQVAQPRPPERPLYEHLSPEERRQLRRDIEQHGREIYRNWRRERRR